MTEVVLPEDQQLLIAGYVLGDLSPEESQKFEQLLAANPHLQDDLAALQQSLGMVYGAEVTPPAHLKSAVLAAANAVNAPEENRSVSPISLPPFATSSRRIGTNHRFIGQRFIERRFPIGVVGALGIAAAMLAVALGVQNYTLRQALQARQSTPTVKSETELLTFALKGEVSSQSGEVDLLVNPDESSAVLRAEGLPSLEEGQVYALWTVVREDAPVTTDPKNAILTAVFTVDAAGRQSQQITVPDVYRDRALIKAVAVSIEDADAPQAHQSDPILIQRL